jgi:hypothetical protein
MKWELNLMGIEIHCITNNGSLYLFYLKGEKPPHAFCLIERNLNKGIVRKQPTLY